MTQIRSKLTTKTNKHTIDDLRKAGYKVFITHRRIWEPDVKWTNKTVGYFDPYGFEVDSRVVRKVPRKNTVLRSFKEAYEHFGSIPKVIEYGGSTTVEVTHPDGTIFEGVAPCSTLDRYNRHIGRTIALGRALKLLVAYENGELPEPVFEDN